MPRKAAVRRTSASSTPVQRSRTGCLTCRQRKLKCDEVRPVCGHCRKSQRECHHSQGITFRHQQNASIADEGDKSSLKGFFKYRNEYTPAQKGVFVTVPVPGELKWVSVDPSAEDWASPPPESPRAAAVQQVAAHSLEALSTAADISYTPQQPQHAAYYTAAAPSTSHPEYGFVRPENVGNGLVQQGNSIRFVPNASQGQTHSSVIDPSLEAFVAQVAHSAEGLDGGVDIKTTAHEDEASEEDRADSQVAMALRNFNETPT